MPAARHLPADQRRIATIEAAVQLAGEQNPSDVTTGAIAQAMGVTQPALFRHFATKDAIWAGVMEWVAERLLANVDRCTASTASPLAALEATFMGHVEFVARHPGVPRVLLAELQRAEDTAAKRTVHGLLRRYGERIRSLIEEGKERGEVAAVTDATAAATLFIGTIQGLVLSSLISGRPARLRAAAPGAFSIYRRGIGSTS
ncbi:TetR/AcrR family transcriptional regulator [Anaeromyxobacter sp. Fw109-5]|uniref:TetR/AcrR family transcriptional regulator n=1 Tax=Anaeromyxobacter sp. (strain Fw109-5) TaxID=404589 RepID=UPI0000ED7F86|nr:TetR/AcrR family transcriptional regulator [Anaeromyxobacter sp. Fw109-5]ABS25255.1 transcriptional regulator, TetR family [Anaeromyxobacter sp. Fw109-5]